ncbi:MAG: hypothetical protein H7Y08_06285 [Rhizobiaceae bacterium]|nr:hypothetical protein [Rhizobiaceae bacterium]
MADTMFDHEEAGDGPDEADAGDPSGLQSSMADLFFALVGVVVFLLITLLPAIQAKNPAAAMPDDLWAVEMTLGAEPAFVAVAGADGLRLPADGNRTVALGAVLDDPALASTLSALVAGGRNILLVIEPDGSEAAFLFEALTGAVGVADIHQVRMDTACDFARDIALRRACLASRRRGAT